MTSKSALHNEFSSHSEANLGCTKRLYVKKKEKSEGCARYITRADVMLAIHLELSLEMWSKDERQHHVVA